MQLSALKLDKGQGAFFSKNNMEESNNLKHKLIEL